METYNVICINKDGPLVLVMADTEFKSKNGHKEPWGSTWRKIEAESYSDARELAFKQYQKLYPSARLAKG